MPRRSKQPEKAERALIEQLQRVQAEASLARVASAAKGDQPAMTLRLESMVTSGALEATSSSKAGDGVAAIPASKTYMSLVAEKFYRRVMPAIDPRCKHNFTNPKKNKGIAYKLFLFFTQVAPNSKPIARDAQNFVQVHTAVAKAVVTMEQFTYPEHGEIDWNECGTFSIEAQSQKLVHNGHGIKVDLPTVCQDAAEKWRLDKN
mmetsp:Transcript_77481/g.199473  ORF Transcript_77481/g.199473 Transcript_77481/m.199473 type:complete len:204 (+) Transcript_77481:58-669(+)